LTAGRKENKKLTDDNVIRKEGNFFHGIGL
jgi:hypothetical protein